MKKGMKKFARNLSIGHLNSDDYRDLLQKQMVNPTYNNYKEQLSLDSLSFEVRHDALFDLAGLYKRHELNRVGKKERRLKRRRSDAVDEKDSGQPS